MGRSNEISDEKVFIMKHFHRKFKRFSCISLTSFIFLIDSLKGYGCLARESKDATQQEIVIHATTCHTLFPYETALGMQTKHPISVPPPVAPFILLKPSFTLHATMHCRKLESVKSGRRNGLPVSSAAVRGNTPPKRS